MIAAIRAILRSNRASAAVEFVMCAPLLIYIMLGIANYGILIMDQMRLATAVSAGAQYAVSFYNCYCNTAGQPGQIQPNFQLFNATPALWTTSYAQNVVNVVNTTANLTGLKTTVSYDPHPSMSGNVGPSFTATVGGPTSSVTGTTATVDNTVCWCASGAAGNWTFTQAANCTSSCGTVYAGIYATIQSTFTYTPIVNVLWFGSNTYTESAIVRVQ